jgi:uncharacterized repeat protein (TIGR01451 family)
VSWLLFWLPFYSVFKYTTLIYRLIASCLGFGIFYVAKCKYGFFTMPKKPLACYWKLKGKIPTDMKTNNFNGKISLAVMAATLLGMLICLSASAQFRNYAKVYSDNLKGGTTLFGNTLSHIVTNNVADTARMNNNHSNGNSSFGNDNANMQAVDVDGNTGAGAATRNSSSANLVLPNGTNTIKLARLYWGARVRHSEFNTDVDTARRVKIKFGNSSAYTEYAAAQMDRNASGSGNSLSYMYQAYTDVTAFVQANGAGTYTVGNIAASTGSTGNGGNYAGWCIVVVYENPLENFNSIRVYDGFQRVWNSGSVQVSSVTLTGLNVPSGVVNAGDAKMGAMVWEGDANLRMDFLKINNNKFANGINAIDNPWNGTISDNGVHVSNKYPNYTNQMGIDIDQFYVGQGYGIQPGDTTVELEFGTEADQYFPGLFTFQIKTNEPTVLLDKLVTDANLNRIAEAGEVLTYKLKGRNVGAGNANYCIVTDTLPANVTYVAGSMRVVNGTGFTANTQFTDIAGDDQAEFVHNGRVIVVRVGSGADAQQGGTLANGESFEIEFSVTVNTPGQLLNILPVINVARMTGYSDAGFKSTDDGTAILEPQGGPLPVTLKQFTAVLAGSLVQVKWITTMEINCKYYQVERSFDGRTFNTVATVDGSGNSSVEKAYSTADNIAGIDAPQVYYRLKQVDFDGKSSISKVIPVRLKKATTDFAVSPNPFSSYVNINIEWSKTESTVVKVFSVNGRELMAKSVNMNKGSNLVQLNDLNSLPAGNYFIQFNTTEGRIVKQVVKH